MKSSFIFTLTLVLVTLSFAKKGGPPKCDENFLQRFCSDDGDARGKEMMSSMSAECKTKFESIMPQMKSEKAAACAKKDDVNAACSAIQKGFETMRTTMGEGCKPKRPPGGPKGGKAN